LIWVLETVIFYPNILELKGFCSVRHCGLILGSNAAARPILYTQDNEHLFDDDPSAIAVIQSYAPPACMLVPLIMLNPLNCSYAAKGVNPPIFLAVFTSLLIAGYVYTLLITSERVKSEVHKMRLRCFVPGANLRFLPFGFSIPNSIPNIAPWQPYNVLQALVDNINAPMENDEAFNYNILEPV
jgi:hypothetical protein